MRVLCSRVPGRNRGTLLLAAGLTLCTLLLGHYYPITDPRLADPELQAPADEPRHANSSPSPESPGSRCLHSGKSKLKADSLFGSVLRAGGPVLMWDEHARTAWRQLEHKRPPYGCQGLPESLVASALQLLNHSANRWLFDAHPPQGCVRCAVVGNGGILNASRQGGGIDAHDFVFRVNGAILKGFEEDVGNKTSFYVFTVNTMKNSLLNYQSLGFTAVPRGQDLRYIIIPSDLIDYVMLKSAILGVPVPDGDVKYNAPWTYFGPEASAHKFKFVHPAFVSNVTDSFLNSSLLQTETGHLYRPSTGALMLLTALHTCDHVSAYGFITENHSHFSDHYYDKEKKSVIFYVNHDMRMEAALWKSLHQRGLLWLYQREH